MLISVIICTIRLAEILNELLSSLGRQTHRELEVLVVGGSDASAAIEYENRLASETVGLQFITSTRGLARARNAGLRHAKGDIVCFLDDDVVIGPDFFAKVAAEFQSPDMADVGGITAYDVVNYAYPVPLRWKLRRLLGITPSLEPGYCTPLGRSVPCLVF